MDIMRATDVRKNWSMTLDTVVRERPAYITRTHDNIALIDVNTLNEILSGYRFIAERLDEPDGSVTLSLKDMDIISNGADLDTAKQNLASDIKEYAEEFYTEYPLWSSAPNRKKHIPYVFKALTLTEDKIAENIINA